MGMEGGLDALMQKSVKQGVDFLEKNQEQITIRLAHGGWNFADMESDAAKQLEVAIDENIGHSGSSFGFALKAVIAEAQKKLGYKMEMKDDEKGDKIVTISK